MEEGKEDTSCPRMYGRLLKYHWRGLLIFLIPLVFLPIMIPAYEPHNRGLYIFCVMAAYWMGGLLPPHVTGLIPVCVMPFIGVLDSDDICKCYMVGPLAIFLGAAMLGLAFQYSNLNTRIAITLITKIGCSPKRALFGLIMASGLTSMFLFNVAVATFMLPIAQSLLEEFEAGGLKIKEDKKPGQEEEDREPSSLATGCYLAVCYAATIGGCGTLIGSPTNIGFRSVYEILYKNNTGQVIFQRFTAYNCPWVLVALFLLYLTLLITHFGLCRPKNETSTALSNFAKSSNEVAASVKQKFADLGSLSIHEIQIIILLLILLSILLSWPYIVRTDFITAPTAFIPIVAMLYILPAHYRAFKFCGGRGPFTDRSTGSVLSWKYANTNLPWGIVFVIGSGNGLAKTFLGTGLSPWIADKLTMFSTLPLPILQFIAILFGAFITTFCANVAAINIVIPLISELAIAAELHPIKLLFPAALGCSVSFLFPFSTPTNALVATHAKISTKKMALGGIIPTLTAISLIYATVICYNILGGLEGKT
ncbi:protein I'm not dead yet-like [Anastrepha ludens]|uniref:protein I'm not dead yet-like n=1 Tax=Anastrepha ludens TaxID=28586 RepID=UPI0023B03B85|nr:protein I'm not dead yet-like [Anastrepha ludens]